MRAKAANNKPSIVALRSFPGLIFLLIITKPNPDKNPITVNNKMRVMNPNSA
jgi:hypothetical protein